MVMGDQQALHPGLVRDVADLLARRVTPFRSARLPGLMQQSGHTRNMSDGLGVEFGVGAIGESVADAEARRRQRMTGLLPGLNLVPGEAQRVPAQFRPA